MARCVIANGRRGRPLNSVVRHQAMGDLGGLIAWALIAGVVAGVVLHFNVPHAQRSTVIRWCLVYGSIAVAFYVGAFVLGSDLKQVAVTGVGAVGFPAFVVGIFMTVANLFARPSGSNKETPGV